MSSFDPAVAYLSSQRPDYLPPPPRAVALNNRGRWSRAGCLLGLLLTPPFVLWVGDQSGENVRALATQGRSATGQIVVRG